MYIMMFSYFSKMWFCKIISLCFHGYSLQKIFSSLKNLQIVFMSWSIVNANVNIALFHQNKKQLYTELFIWRISYTYVIQKRRKEKKKRKRETKRRVAMVEMVTFLRLISQCRTEWRSLIRFLGSCPIFLGV